MSGKAALSLAGIAIAVATMVAISVAVSMVSTRGAHAALPRTPFTVNGTGDLGDADLDDSPNVCDAILSIAGNQCTLRAAIQESNNTPGADRIEFKIGTGLKVISPNSALPTIIDPVTIDGYTQPGASVNTRTRGTNAQPTIELDGSNAGNANGLFLSSDLTGHTSTGSVVRGLVINRFQRTGIAIAGDGGIAVEGNFLGTDPTGTADEGNGFAGVDVGGAHSVVGGTTLEARNLVSGNGLQGVNLGCCGGANKVQGNLIGTKSDGISALGNTSSGVRVQNDKNQTVGGTGAGASNTVAFNGGDGVEIGGGTETTNVRVLQNSIFSNSGLGINLPPGGPNLNDPKDADTGANGLQNKPVLTSVAVTGGNNTVEGRLNSTPNKTFAIRVFSNPSGTEEGKVYRDTVSVTTNDRGNARFTATFPAVPRPGQTVMTATATGAQGTSEFSAPLGV